MSTLLNKSKTARNADLEGFAQTLRERDLVPDNHVRYMLWWVSHYLSLGKPEDQKYADQLESEGREDWQIRQALDAISIYRNMYGKPDDKCLESDPPLRKLAESLRVRHYARSTVKAYLYWSERYLEYCDENSLDKRKDESFRVFLTHLALKKKVASSTQNQAFNALLYLFRNVWGQEPSEIDAVRARRPRRLPAVLTKDEVKKVLDAAGESVAALILRLIYSSGLRLSEALRLRVKDLDLNSCSITVRSGKGNKDRVTVLGRSLVPVLRHQLEAVRKTFKSSDVPASLPGALERKYPAAGMDWAWQYVFSSSGPSVEQETGLVRRHHIHRSGVQKTMRNAVKKAGIEKRAGIHTLRHCFATHLLISGVDLCEIQELLGHKSLETTRIYLHVMKGIRNDTESPYDLIAE